MATANPQSVYGSLIAGVDFGLPGRSEDFDSTYVALVHLGSGAYADIFSMRDKTDNSVAAVKVSWLSKAQGLLKWKSNQSKALQEIKIYHAIQGMDLKSGHENILKFIGWYATVSADPTRYETIYTIFEKCDVDLYQRFYMEIYRNLTEDETKPVVKQIALGLRFLHGKNIVHRDIKMANVLCAHPNQLTPIKLCDFNLSRYIAPNQRPSPMGDSVGTRSTMDPQRLSRKLDSSVHIAYGRKCDCWSLGHIMHELLTRNYLFAVDSLCGAPDCAAMIEQPNGTKAYDTLSQGLCKECVARNHQMRCTRPFVAEESEVSNRTEACKDILTGLLRINEADRLSINECLGHEWLNS